MRPLLALLLRLGDSSPCSDLVSVCLNVQVNNGTLGSVFTSCFLLLQRYTPVVFIRLRAELDPCLSVQIKENMWYSPLTTTCVLLSFFKPRSLVVGGF